jgi:alcohol dehydrogenase, propanol-preferring
MQRAAAAGAVTVPGGPDQVAQIREVTGGKGVDAAFDFVGVSGTIALAQGCMGQRSRLTVVGIAGGAAQWSFFTNPYECELTNTYWGTIEDLHEVVAMYRAGQIRPEVQRFEMDRALDAYEALEAGRLSGRAVVMPNA